MRALDASLVVLAAGCRSERTAPPAGTSAAPTPLPVPVMGAAGPLSIGDR